MKFTFTLCAMLFCGQVFGAEPLSVIAVGSPAPALVAVQQPARGSCANGKCKLYSVDPQAYETHRHRVLGGSVTRKGTRTVVRPVR